MSKFTEWLARTAPTSPLRTGKRPKGGDEIRLVEYDVTFDALKDVDHPAPPGLDARLPELVQLLYDDPARALPRVEAMLEEFPDECHLLNLYANALSATGQEQRSMEVTERNYRLHPTYLFARINYAEVLIVTGRIGEVRAVFGGQIELKHMYPHRNVFHYTEVIGMFSLTGRYFIALGDLEGARRCLKLLQQLDPDHNATQALSRQIAAAVVRGALSKLREKLPGAPRDASSTPSGGALPGPHPPASRPSHKDRRRDKKRKRR